MERITSMVHISRWLPSALIRRVERAGAIHQYAMYFGGLTLGLFLGSFLFPTSIQAQALPFTVFTEGFDYPDETAPYSTTEITPPWVDYVTPNYSVYDVSGNFRLRQGSLSSGAISQRRTGLSVSSGYQRLFFDYYAVSGTQAPIEVGFNDADFESNLNGGTEHCYLAINTGGNPRLRNVSGTTIHNPSLGSPLSNGDSARYYLDIDSNTERCRIGMVSSDADVSYFSGWYDMGDWYDDPITRFQVFRSGAESASGLYYLDDFVYQISSSMFPASGSSVTTIGGGLVVPASDYLVVNYPQQGDITASTTFSLDIDYELPIERGSYNNILGSFCSQTEQLSGLPDCEHHTLASEIGVDTPTNITPEITLDYEGAYIGFISFWNGVEENIDCNWYAIWCDEEIQMLWETQSISFSSATTTTMLVTPYYRENAMNMCDQLPIGADYFCQAMVWLFVPSSDVYINATNRVWNEMSQKIPFGFFIYAKDTLGNIIATPDESSYVGVVVDVPILGGERNIVDLQALKEDEFFNRLMNTINPYAEFFIWFALLAYIWNRMRGVDLTPPNADNIWGVK